MPKLLGWVIFILSLISTTRVHVMGLYIPVLAIILAGLLACVTVMILAIVERILI